MMQKRALVVDDEPALCEFIHGVLTSAGMEALTLTKGTEAAVRLEKEKFDIVLLDLRMPAPTGIDLTRQMRASGFNQATPVIIMSDDQRPAAVSEGFEAGANFFLYKPIDKTRLMRLLRATHGSVEHERRRFRRVDKQLKVHLKSGNSEIQGETIDLSLNGLLVRASRTFPPQAKVHVSLHLVPAMKPIVGLGSVMRVLGNDRMGIQLDRLPIEESGRLEEYLLPLIPE